MEGGQKNNCRLRSLIIFLISLSGYTLPGQSVYIGDSTYEERYEETYEDDTLENEDYIDTTYQEYYKSIFLKDSNTSGYKDKAVFREDLQNKYKKLYDKYEEDPLEEVNEDNQWLARFLRKLFSFIPNLNLSAITTVVRFIIYGVLILVLFYFLKFFFYKDISWAFWKKKKNTIEQNEPEDEINHLTDFEAMIRKSLNDGNKRMAVRYYYLWLLNKLDAHHIITMNPEKTNSDYLYEIKNANFKSSFAYLSYIYDYIWYGEAEVGDLDFIKVRDSFDRTLRQIV